MEYLENNNYLETPFAKNLEEFKTYHEDIWKKHWSVLEVEIFQDTYCIGISEMWTENKLCENNYIDIYKNIIIKCRSLECQASRQQDKAWEEQLKKLREQYQVELLKTLTENIRDFCMEA